MCNNKFGEKAAIVLLKHIKYLLFLFYCFTIKLSYICYLYTGLVLSRNCSWEQCLFWVITLVEMTIVTVNFSRNNGLAFLKHGYIMYILAKVFSNSNSAAYRFFITYDDHYCIRKSTNIATE